MAVTEQVENSKKNGVRIIKANYTLQGKIGSGPLDQKVVERCQTVMDNNKVDFAPLAEQYLDELKLSIAEARQGNKDVGQVTESITAPVMQLKANAKTFNYGLIGNLANIMLSFLEAIKVYDKDVLAIVEAHHVTLSAIVNNKMAGNGGQYGIQMEEELKKACKRYFDKKKA